MICLIRSESTNRIVEYGQWIGVIHVFFKLIRSRREKAIGRGAKNKKLDNKMERNKNEMIIIMTFSRFIDNFFFLLYSITLTIIVKTETHGPLKSRPGIRITFRFF